MLESLYVLGKRLLIRTEEEKDWAAVYALNAAAFETPAEANLVDALRQQAGPVVSLVADDNQTVVSHMMKLRRSEEHTSELHSPYDLVCRLLLEKKKNEK